MPGSATWLTTMSTAIRPACALDRARLMPRTDQPSPSISSTESAKPMPANATPQYRNVLSISAYKHAPTLVDRLSGFAIVTANVRRRAARVKDGAVKRLTKTAEKRQVCGSDR